MSKAKYKECKADFEWIVGYKDYESMMDMLEYYLDIPKTLLNKARVIKAIQEGKNLKQTARISKYF